MSFDALLETLVLLDARVLVRDGKPYLHLPEGTDAAAVAESLGPHLREHRNAVLAHFTPGHR